MYGYGQLEHFEYTAMQLLGPSIAEQQKDGAGVMRTWLAALQHIHSLGINQIIDFGISKPFSRGQPNKYDPLEDRRHIVGPLYWASLNSHNGRDLASRDDIESLALIALFLLRGNLPWKPRRPRLESQLRSQEVIRFMKSAPRLRDNQTVICKSGQEARVFPR
ncbi:hypothetical protein BS47DRAFT_1390966 [Hydnum rufescens UP504]|uniref:Protein kinase domain-containing protein n=1 Tax=Hydnum rufescens UP504 TaxID=1448309 RepID=A0A9P6B210_9AGAM|nr:hypothetical protein BS47DRAFT_1390966 [Hydnum rufescens UP504]